MQPVDIADQIVAQPQYFSNALHPLVLPRSLFKIHLGAQPIACRRRDADQCSSVASQEFAHSIHLAPVFLNTDDLLARPQAHIHFPVNAARMLRTRLEVFLAAPNLEKIQELIFEKLSRAARAERPIVKRRPAPKTRSDFGPTTIVPQNQLDLS